MRLRHGGWVKRSGSALSQGLGARATGTELPHGNGVSLPRNEGCVLGGRVAGFPPLTVFTAENFSGVACVVNHRTQGEVKVAMTTFLFLGVIRPIEGVQGAEWATSLWRILV